MIKNLSKDRNIVTYNVETILDERFRLLLPALKEQEELIQVCEVKIIFLKSIKTYKHNFTFRVYDDSLLYMP